MKKLLTSVLLCGALLSLSACGSDDNSSDNSKEKELQATIDSQSKEIKKLKSELESKEKEENKVSDTDKEYQIGDTVEYKGLKVKIKSINFDYKNNDGMADDQPKNGHNINIETEIINNTKKTIDPSTDIDFEIEEDGVVADDDSGMTNIGIQSINDNQLFDVSSLRPGAKKTAWEITDYNFNKKDYKLLLKMRDSEEFEDQEFVFNLNSVMKDAPKK